MKQVIEILQELRDSAARTRDQIPDEQTYVIVHTKARLLGKVMAYDRAISEIESYLISKV